MQSAARNTVPGGWLARALVALWFAVGSGTVLAASGPFDVQIIVAEQSPAQDELLEAVQAVVAKAPERPQRLRTLTAREYADQGLPAGSPPHLIVTVGSASAEAVLRDRPSIPVFCAFLPQAAYEALRPPPARSRDWVRMTALFVDQPLSRQMRLLRLVLPRLAQAAVVLGPESQRVEPALRSAAGAAGFGLRVETIREERQLVGALHRVLEEADVPAMFSDS